MKYTYYNIIQQQKTRTHWKDIYKMDVTECSAADAESKLNAFRSRNKNSIYRIIKRRVINENHNIFREFDR